MRYAIHKSLPYTASEIDNAINELKDIPEANISLWADGWVIVDPEGYDPKPWTRNTADYAISEIPNRVQSEIKKQIICINVL